MKEGFTFNYAMMNLKILKGGLKRLKLKRFLVVGVGKFIYPCKFMRKFGMLIDMFVRTTINSLLLVEMIVDHEED